MNSHTELPHNMLTLVEITILLNYYYTNHHSTFQTMSSLFFFSCSDSLLLLPDGDTDKVKIDSANISRI